MATNTAVAKKAGLTHQAVSNKVRKGMTHAQILAQARERAKLKKAGMVNRSDKGAQLVGGRKKHAHSGLMQIRKETFNDASLRKEIALANKQELEVSIRKGELIPIGAANAFFGSLVIRAREVLMGIPDLNDRIRQEPDALKSRKMIDDEVRRGLEELEKYAQGVAGATAGGEA